MNWNSPVEVEALLAAGVLASSAEWRRVKEYLTSSFARFMGQEVEPVWEPTYEDISPRSAFAFGIRSRNPLGGSLGIEWYGVISVGGGHVEVIVLLFSHDARIIPLDRSEYLYFEFLWKPDGLQYWQSRGWSHSEMGEWDGYQRLSEVCKRMSEAHAGQAEETE